MDYSPAFDATQMVTKHETNGMTPEEKRARALSHLQSVELGKRRGSFALPREHFDPTLRSHLESYKSFLDTGAWGAVLFHQEFPYDSVVETVTRKFAISTLEHMLSN